MQRKGQNIPIDASPRMIHRWHINKWKEAQPYTSFGNCKFKWWVTTTRLLEWPKSGGWTPPNSGEHTEQKGLSFIVGGKAKWHSLLGKQFGNFWPKWTCFYHVVLHSCSWIFTQRSWKRVSPKKLAHRVRASLFIIAQTCKQPRYPSVGKWINSGPSDNEY